MVEVVGNAAEGFALADEPILKPTGLVANHETSELIAFVSVAITA